MHELSLSMPKPMLSLSMLILAKSCQSKSKSRLTKVPVGSQNIKFGPKWDGNRRFGLKDFDHTNFSKRIHQCHLQFLPLGRLTCQPLGPDGAPERLWGCRGVKINMLRLNIGSGMLRLNSCMLSIDHGP